MRDELLLPAEFIHLKTAVIDAALHLHRTIGPGFREPMYRRLLAHGLRQRGFHVAEEVWLPVTYQGLTVEQAVRADLIVEERVIVELKAVEALHSVHEAQLLSYLKASRLPLGLLFNFNVSLLMKQGYRKMVHPAVLKGEFFESPIPFPDPMMR